MDDPTKDTIPRSAVEYCLRKETVSTNPEKYKTHEKFIDYMDDPGISEFGHWMHSNGFNCALTAISVDLKKNPSVTPSAQQWTPVTKRLPKAYESVNVTVKIPEGRYVQESALMDTGWKGISAPAEVVAWCPLLVPWEGEQDGERKDGDGND